MPNHDDGLARSYDEVADIERLSAAPRAVGASWILILFLVLALAVPHIFGSVPGKTAAVAHAARGELTHLGATLPAIAPAARRQGRC